MHRQRFEQQQQPPTSLAALRNMSSAATSPNVPCIVYYSTSLARFALVARADSDDRRQRLRLPDPYLETDLPCPLTPERATYDTTLLRRSKPSSHVFVQMFKLSYCIIACCRCLFEMFAAKLQSLNISILPPHRVIRMPARKCVPAQHVTIAHTHSHHPFSICLE